MKREPGKPQRRREHTSIAGQPGEPLQKLDHIAFAFDEEETLTLVDVTRRMAPAFDVERVTKRFYDRFKTEHAAFLQVHRRHHRRGDTRVVRLADAQPPDVRLLHPEEGLSRRRHRLPAQPPERCAGAQGAGQVPLLLPLLSAAAVPRGAGQAKARAARPRDAARRVPYLNGGLFDVHELEQRHGDIEIPDEAFERIFDFFDGYQWHLDERPLRADNEINPDVLGYIFEKYINQKQMGAYYTKEDITEYIGKNTVLPFLFERRASKCKIAFARPESEVWRLLQRRPRPLHLRAGAAAAWTLDAAAGDRRRGRAMSRSAAAGTGPPHLALPTETWREHVPGARAAWSCARSWRPARSTTSTT